MTFMQEQPGNSMITALNIIIERGIQTKEQLPDYAHWYVGISNDGKTSQLKFKENIKINTNGE